MSQCFVCQSKYTEGLINTCSVCGWDLTPATSTIEQISEAFLAKEQLKLSWARQTWKLAQNQISDLKLNITTVNQEELQLQTQLKELNQKLAQARERVEKLKAQSVIILAPKTPSQLPSNGQKRISLFNLFQNPNKLKISSIKHWVIMQIIMLITIIVLSTIININ